MVQVGGGIHDASRYEDTPNLLPVVEPQGETLGAGTNHVQRTRQPDPLRQGSRCLELLRRLNDLGIDDRYRRVRAGRVKADFVKRAVEDVLEANEIAEQAFIETVAVLVVCGDIPHHFTEQVKPGQARVGACGPELLLPVKFRRRLAQGGSLEVENRCVIALVVNESQIGSGFQPAGTRTTNIRLYQK